MITKDDAQKFISQLVKINTAEREFVGMLNKVDDTGIEVLIAESNQTNQTMSTARVFPFAQILGLKAL